MLEELEANRRTVRALYLATVAKDFEAAATLIGPRYVQQNPAIADGIVGFRAFSRSATRQLSRPACGGEANRGRRRPNDRPCPRHSRRGSARFVIYGYKTTRF
jgi:hypothetical protein